MKNRLLHYLFLIVPLVISLSACDTIGLSREVPISPLTEARGESVLPSPTPAPAFDATSLEIGDDLGALTGVIRVHRDGELVPVSDVKIGIGGVLVDDEGQVRMVGYDASTAPSSTTDESGRFLFTDLEPGQYGLIFDIVMSSFLLFDEETREPILVDVEAGELTDMGVLDYENLPVPE